MNTRERFQAIVNGQPFDRLPLLEWASWWDKTIERWHGEGLPEELTDRYDICEYFGLDIYRQQWVPVLGAGCPKPKRHGAELITAESDYEALRPFLFPEDTVDEAHWKKAAEEQAEGKAVIWFTVDGFFWFPRKLLGIEQHLFAFFDEPELMHRINSDLAEWILKTIDRICSFCTPDFMTFGEDMSYNNGPMISKALFDEFMRPYYDRVIPALRERGIMPIIDSDGDISKPAYWFAEAGIEGILPLERQSGVDIAVLRENHPGMKFVGHFDKMTMDKGEDAMRTEFERLLPIAAKGGFLISCDHQTPPGVSLENYRIYLKLFSEYAERAGKMSKGSAVEKSPCEMNRA